MFSGKTEELIRRLRRAVLARQVVEVFKPRTDDRYGLEQVVSHSAQRLDARPVGKAHDILDWLGADVDVVGIDEAQFFGEDVVQLSETLAGRGVRVVVAGLDTDYTGRPFHPVPALMARAEYVTKLLAVCVRCGSPANRSLRIGDGRARIEVGGGDRYEAVCRACHAGAAVGLVG